ncbi:MAG: hypothetical protein VX474_07080 [Pseudomonadota bacterium]|nr:hypothetical protein [Pseudomonadota bacterium]MEC8102323.1 hypothetical protein [Pseudomonadota bacterium]MEE2749724.1 hypothetical protein [Pseudomonadota bacterium]
MTERFPDLEIYLLKGTPDAIRDWLSQTFNGVTDVKVSDEHCHWQVAGMDVFLNVNAEKNFSSLWFKQNKTPWNTDLELARAAYSGLSTEIRCSDSGWQESEGEASSGGWIKLNSNGEKPFNWQ